MNPEKFAFLTTLVEYPEETATAEYKSGIAFDPTDDFGAKLVKHILGMANAGGGYVIIGFKEQTSGKLLSDPAMNASVSGSYETTRLSQSVDRYLASGQRIELQVHKIEANSITYPVISVQSFGDSPLFCGRDFNARDTKPILKEGAIYIRDIAAKTVIVAGPDQFKGLLKVAVGRRQSEVLNQLRSLLVEMGLSLPSGSSVPLDTAAEVKFEEWSQDQRAAALREMTRIENQE
jgi:predicted HTH transcriptional regulator